MGLGHQQDRPTVLSKDDVFVFVQGRLSWIESHGLILLLSVVNKWLTLLGVASGKGQSGGIMSIPARGQDGADLQPPRTANDAVFLAVASVIMALLAVAVAVISFAR